LALGRAGATLNFMPRRGQQIRVGARTLVCACAITLAASCGKDEQSPAPAFIGDCCGGAGEGPETPGGRSGGADSEPRAGMNAAGGTTATSGAPNEGGESPEPSEAGAGGSGETEPPVYCWGAVGCDDANPCTLDSCDALDGCTHQPVTDGAACDDADACTEGDVCKKGECLGAPRASQASLTGRLSAFGATGAAATSYEQLVAPVSPSRLLFLEPVGRGQTRLLLAAAEADSLSELDELTLDMPYTVKKEPLYWKYVAENHVVPLGGGRVAVLGTGYGIDIFDLSTDKLQLLSHRPAADNSVARAAAAFGDWLWVCRTGQLEPYGLAPDGSLTPYPAQPLKAVCRDLAVSADGKRLWLATMAKGLVAMDLATPGAPQLLPDNPLPAMDLLAVEERGGLLAAQQLKQSDLFGDIVVLSASSLQQVARFSPTPGRLPVSIHLLPEQTLAIQWLSLGAAGGKLELVRYELGTSNESGVVGAVASWSSTTHAFDGQSLGYDGWQAQPSPPTLPAATNAGGAALLVTEPGARVLRVDSSRATLVSGPAHGGFSALAALPERQVIAFGGRSVHRVDLKDPQQPHLTSGGLLPVSAVAGLHVWSDDSAAQAQLVCRRERGVLSARADGLETFEDASARLLRLAGAEAAPSGEQRLTGPARLFATGRALYVLTPGSSTSFQLDILDATAAPASPLPLHWRQQLEGGSARSGLWSFWRFAADDKAGQLLLAEPAPSGDTTSLRWFERGPASWELVAESELSGVPDAMVLSGERAALLMNASRLEMLERKGAATVSRGARDWSANSVHDLVAFDGRRLGVSLRNWAGSGPAFQLQVLNADDLSVLTEYGLENPARALLTQGEQLLIATGTNLHVAAPACVTTTH
jgi:hypothetical protein